MWDKLQETIPEAYYRALRTFVQVVGGAVVLSLGTVGIAVLQGYQATHYFDWSMLWYDGIVAGLAAGIAILMNMGKK